MSKVSMSQIAEELGISKSLVSLALSNKYGVSDETRFRVYVKAIQMGYSFHKNGSPGTKGGRFSITVFIKQIDLITDRFWPEILAGVERTLANDNYRMRTYVWDAETTTDDLLVNIVETKPDGLIVISELPEGALDQLANVSIPVVLVDGKAFVDGIFDSVRANNYLGGRLAASHLLSKGHIRFAYIGDAEQSVSFRERLNGFRDQILRTNPNARFIGVTASARDCSETECLFCPEELDRLLETMDLPFAIMCANDVVAAMMYERLKTTSLRIPEDVSIVGFDNVLLSSTYRPALTSINVHKKEIGQIAVDLILERIKHPDRSKQSVMVNVELIERKSVANLTATMDFIFEPIKDITIEPLPTKEIQ